MITKYIKGDMSSTIWRIMRGGKRKPLAHWKEYEAAGFPPISLVPEAEMLAMPLHKPPDCLVVTPTVDRPERCRRAILSLAHQGYPYWESVIIKNGPPAQSARYVEQLQYRLIDTRAHLVQIHGEGLALALNAGFSFLEEHHLYVAVLEDDDEWDPRFLKSMINALELAKADVVYCKQRQVPDRRQFDGEPLNRKRMLHRNQINWPMSLFRAEALKGVLPIDEGVGPATDWDTHLRLLTAGAKYHFLDEPLATHYWHNSNYCLVSGTEGPDAIARKREKGEYYDAETS